MTKHYTLSAAKRDGAGKGAARAIRREKNIPAVIYGDKKEPVTITLPAKEVTLEYHKGHMFTTLCDLVVDGEKSLVLARDVQLHPVKDNVMHVDFLRVSAKTKITVEVPVHFINHEESPGIKAKGNFNVVRHEVALICQATAIPENIEVDLTPFEIGDAIKISNAKLPEGAVPEISDRDFTLATITAPRTAAEIEADEEEAAAEEAAADAANKEEGAAKLEAEKAAAAEAKEGKDGKDGKK